MKTLVTHINPHLDDICAIWLFKKFFKDFKDANLEFISAQEGIKGLKDTQDRVHFGVGVGRYDEHKGDLKDCATSLVWKDILENNLAPKDKVEFTSFEEIVEWSRLIDLGRFPLQEYDDFSIQAFIRPENSTQAGSKKATKLGEDILDRVLEVLKRKHKSLKDWQKRVEFETKFGRSFAVYSEYINRAFCKKQKGELFLMVNPKDKSVQFFTPDHNLDLEPIYEACHTLEPDAAWYLHQSHHMVLCGSGSSPKFTPTRLSFKKLIEIAKKV